MDIQLRTTEGTVRAQVAVDTGGAAPRADAASGPGAAGRVARLSTAPQAAAPPQGLVDLVGAPRDAAFTPATAALSPAAGGWADGAARSSSATKASGGTAKSSGSTSKPAGTSKSTTTSSSKKSSSAASAKELAFLSDPRLSIEEKLFQFMALMTQKSDEQLEEAMRSYGARKEAADAAKKAGSTAPKADASGGDANLLKATAPKQPASGGGGLFGFVGDLVGGVADAVGGAANALVGGVESVAKELGGPLLASAATALGAPFLAPVALSVGGTLSAGLIDGAASLVGLGQKKSPKTSASSSSKTGTSSKSGGAKSASTGADSTTFDEKLEMLKLQQLVDRQSAMFSALSNAMKAMHDMQMTAVGNIR